MWPQKQKVNVLEQFGWIRFCWGEFFFPRCGLSVFPPFFIPSKRSVLVCPLPLALYATVFPSRDSNIKLFFYANWVLGVGGTHDFNELQMFRHECKDAYCLWQVMRLLWRARLGKEFWAVLVCWFPRCVWELARRNRIVFKKIIQEEAFWRRVYR